MSTNIYKNREEVLRLFEEEVYGRMPEKPLSVDGKITSSDARFAASKATLETVELTCETKNGTVRFPFWYCHKNGAEKQKTVVILNFRPDMPDKYVPAEELIDMGWNFACVDYQKVSVDSAEIDENARILREGLSPAPGKICVWAWAAMRIFDYLTTRPETDPAKTGVAGHSRLGKTALVAAAFDERFAFAHSNCSGTAGAALFSMRNDSSESIGAITRAFPYWFCDKFADYVGKEREMPFDQDMLLSTIAPRILTVNSAVEDLWANPAAERECAKRASRRWEQMGVPGFAADEKNGKVAHFLRTGIHYFSRDDWRLFLPFVEKNLEN